MCWFRCMKRCPTVSDLRAMFDEAGKIVAHELAADQSWADEYAGFRVKGGTVIWEDAEYTPSSNRVKIARLLPVGDKLRVMTRYVDPETRVILVETA
jgi:hypothetical protein